jgi:ribosomal protein RSM22 (predicted rRNA methylase)
VNGDPYQGWRHSECKKAHRSGYVAWSKGRTNATERIHYSSEAAEAYAIRRFLPSHALHTRVMREIALELGGEFTPSKAIDFGCGPGAGLVAAAQMWPESLVDLVGVDSSMGMLETADVLLSPPVNSENEHIAPAAWLEPDLLAALAASGGRGVAFDLAILSATLSELRSDVERAATVKALWEELAEGGVMLLLEHGGTVGGHVVSAARRFILENYSENSVSAQKSSTWAELLAPDVHASVQCPVGAMGVGRRDPTWMHFAQFVPNRGPQRQREPMVSETFSYLAVRKVGRMIPPNRPAPGQTTAADIISRDLSGGEGEMMMGSDELLGVDEQQPADQWLAAHRALSTPPYRGGGWARIVSPPRKGKQQVRLQLMTPDASVETLVVSKKLWKGFPGAMTMARRAEWGGLWPWPCIRDQNN